MTCQTVQSVPVLTHDNTSRLHIFIEIRVVGGDFIAILSLSQIERIAFFQLQVIQNIFWQDHSCRVSDTNNF